MQTLLQQKSEKEQLKSNKLALIFDKESALSLLDDVPENQEARQLLQSEIDQLQADVSTLTSEISQIELDIAAYIQRVADLGDISLLLEYHFKNHANPVEPSDSFNLAGFEADKLESSFGWIFANIPKPTLEQLEQIKQDHFS